LMKTSISNSIYPKHVDADFTMYKIFAILTGTSHFQFIKLLQQLSQGAHVITAIPCFIILQARI